MQCISGINNTNEGSCATSQKEKLATAKDNLSGRKDVYTYVLEQNVATPKLCIKCGKVGACSIRCEKRIHLL